MAESIVIYLAATSKAYRDRRYMGTTVFHLQLQEQCVIANIIDHRRRQYRWQCIHAIAEPTWHDNTVEDADQAPENMDKVDIVYEAKRHVDVAHAVTWASNLDCAVTLYLYDQDADIL